MRRPIAIATLAGSLIGGTALGALAFGPPGLSGADAGLMAQTDPDDSTPTDETTADDARPGHGDLLADALAPLVEDGTITQAQADAVIAAIEEAKPERDGHIFFRQFDEAAVALGMSADELRTELEAGKTIAAIASERGVDLQTVIDALVADGNERIDEAVASGRLTEEEAAEAKTNLSEKVTALVNGELPALDGPHRRGRGGFGPFGD